MDVEISLEQDFAKTNRYGGNVYEPKVGVAYIIKQQKDNLVNQLRKYPNFSETLRRSLSEKYSNLPNFRYLNMKYLATAIAIYEQFEEYSEENEVADFVKNLFSDEKRFKPFFANIYDEKRETIPNYVITLKKILFNYIYEINMVNS